MKYLIVLLLLLVSLSYSLLRNSKVDCYHKIFRSKTLLLSSSIISPPSSSTTVSTTSSSSSSSSLTTTTTSSSSLKTNKSWSPHSLVSSLFITSSEKQTLTDNVGIIFIIIIIIIIIIVIINTMIIKQLIKSLTKH